MSIISKKIMNKERDVVTQRGKRCKNQTEQNTREQKGTRIKWNRKSAIHESLIILIQRTLYCILGSGSMTISLPSLGNISNMND